MNTTKMKKENTDTMVYSASGRGCLIPPIELMHNRILTTAFSQEIGSDLKSNSGGSLDEVQIVVAAGPHTDFKIGDVVRLDVDTFPKQTKPGGHDVGREVYITPPFITVGTTQYLKVSDRQIIYKEKQK